MPLLQSLASLLTRDLTGRTWTREQEHSYFGKLTYFGSKNPTDCYWEAELPLSGATDEQIGITMAGTQDGPTLEEQHFCKVAISDMDGLFAKCRSAFEVEFQQRTQTPIPQDWRMAFKLDGFQVPSRGDPDEPWEVCYFVAPAKHYFTAVFERGEVKHVLVDG